jgi:hypothetical protein
MGHIIGYFFPQLLRCINFETLNGLGNIFSIFFTNSPGHPAAAEKTFEIFRETEKFCLMI